MSKDRVAYLVAIHECVSRIRAYTEDGKAAYFADLKTQDAVIRNIEIIGQAVKDFGTDDLALRCPEIPWRQVAGMRNLLAHHYLGVDIEITWQVVENNLDAIDAAVQQATADYASPNAKP